MCMKFDANYHYCLLFLDNNKTNACLLVCLVASKLIKSVFICILTKKMCVSSCISATQLISINNPISSGKNSIAFFWRETSVTLTFRVGQKKNIVNINVAGTTNTSILQWMHSYVSPNIIFAVTLFLNYNLCLPLTFFSTVTLVSPLPPQLLFKGLL